MMNILYVENSLYVYQILIMASPPKVPAKDSDMQISDPPRSKKEYFHPCLQGLLQHILGIIIK